MTPSPIPTEVSEVLFSAQKSTQLMILLSAIPAVGFALWTEYFKKYIQEIRDEKENLDKEAELKNLGTISLGAFTLQALNYLFNSPARHEHPFMSLGVFLAALVFQTFQFSSAERALKNDQDPRVFGLKPQTVDLPNTQKYISSVLWILASTFSYFFLVYLGLFAGVFISHIFLLSPPWTATSVTLGTLTGMILGLFVHFATAPFQLRKILPHTPLEEPRHLEMIKNCLIKAQILPINTYIVEKDQTQTPSAFAAGFQNGKGFFAPSLFITRKLLNTCTPEELQAVILHEFSHIKHHHLRNRVVWIGFLLIAALSLSAITVGFGSALFPELSVVFKLLLPSLFFLGSWKLISKQIRHQEIQADASAIELGAEPEALIETLKRVSGIELTQTPTLTKERLFRLHLIMAGRKQRSTNSQSQKAA